MYDIISLLINNNCMANCKFCIAKHQNFPQTHFTDKFKSFTKTKLITLLSLGNNYNCKNFSISGLKGDPLNFEYLTDVLELSKNIFKNKISIHTNGLLLDKYNVDYFSDIGLTISLYSFNDKINKDIMQTNISNNIIIDFINKYLNKFNANNIKLSKVITINDTRQDIINYLNDCINIGINRVVLRLDYNNKNIKLTINDLYKINKIYNNSIYNYKNKIEVTVWNYHNSTLKGLYLYPDGIIRDKYIYKKES